MESMWTTSPSSRTPLSTALLSVTTVEAPLNPWRVDATIESAWAALPSAGVWGTAARAAAPTAGRRWVHGRGRGRPRQDGSGLAPEAHAGGGDRASGGAGEVVARVGGVGGHAAGVGVGV